MLTLLLPVKSEAIKVSALIILFDAIFMAKTPSEKKA